MTDKEVEDLWRNLEDILFDEYKDGELYLAEDWFIFKKGTSRDAVWVWFDKAYSKGVEYLLWEFES